MTDIEKVTAWLRNDRGPRNGGEMQNDVQRLEDYAKRLIIGYIPGAFTGVAKEFGVNAYFMTRRYASRSPEWRALGRKWEALTKETFCGIV